MSSLVCQRNQSHLQFTTMTYPLEQYAVESKRRTALITCICSQWEFSRCALIAVLALGFGTEISLAVSISWHRFTHPRCHLASCRCSYETQNQSRIPSCPSLKRQREAVLRATWVQGEWHRRRLLQENNPERRLGTRTRYSASGERAELTRHSCGKMS